MLAGHKNMIRVLSGYFVQIWYSYADLSLLMAMKDFSIKQHIVENTLAGNLKGGVLECAIADAFHI